MLRESLSMLDLDVVLKRFEQAGEMWVRITCL